MSCYHADVIILIGICFYVSQVVNKYKFEKVHSDTTTLHCNRSSIPNGLNHISFINTLVVYHLNEQL